MANRVGVVNQADLAGSMEMLADQPISARGALGLWFGLSAVGWGVVGALAFAFL